MTNFDPLTWPTAAAIPFGAYGTTATPATDYRCDTGGCPQITYTGDTVTIVETANPEQVVVTSAAKWDAYLDTVRAQERAAIMDDHSCKPMIVISEVFGGGLEARCGNCGTAEPIGDGGEMSLADLAGYLDAHCQRAEFDAAQTAKFSTPEMAAAIVHPFQQLGGRR